MTTLNAILAIVTVLLGGVNIFQLVYYKTQRDKLRAEADSAQVDAQHKGLDLMQDQADYLMKELSNVQTQYVNLQKQIREESANHTNTIHEKCNEIAVLKSKVVYLKGLRCYKSDCSLRISVNPKDKSDEQQFTERTKE